MTAREKLKSAVAKAAGLENQKTKLESALKIATAAVETATEELGRFSDLDVAIKRYRVDAVKNGGNSRELPQILKDRLAARRNAQEEIEQATSTREAIAEEVDDIQKRLAPMKEMKTSCALDVLREKGDEVAAELIAINERRRDLFQILEGFANIQIPQRGYMGFVGFTPAMGNARISPAHEFYPSQDPIGEMSARWRKRLSLLEADPDAEVTIPSPITPSDYVKNGKISPTLQVEESLKN